MENIQLEKQLESYRQGLLHRRKNKEFVKNLLLRVEEHMALNQPMQRQDKGEQSELSLSDVLKEIESLLSRMNDEIKRGTEYNYNQVSLEFKEQFKKVADELKDIHKREEELQEIIGNDTNFISILYDRLTYYKDRTAIYYQLFQQVSLNLQQTQNKLKFSQEENNTLVTKCKNLIRSRSTDNSFVQVLSQTSIHLHYVIKQAIDQCIEERKVGWLDFALKVNKLLIQEWGDGTRKQSFLTEPRKLKTEQEMPHSMRYRLSCKKKQVNRYLPSMRRYSKMQ